MSVVAPSNRVDVIQTNGGRILCVADVRGKLSLLNDLAKEHSANAIICTGDFGFYEPSSLPKITDRTLKHLIQYSNVISADLRNTLSSPSMSPQQIRQLLLDPNSSQEGFPLSEFPKLLNGSLKLQVPVYAVWGACEDVGVLEKLRTANPSPIHTTSSASQATSSTQSNYSIPNLTILSESSTRVLVIGGVRFRLFGLGGACVPHKMFDNGEGQATIAGGGGTMWTTLLQIGELVDTAARVYDPSETRLLITHASPGRDGLLAQLALAVKADITISASLHFRYGVSYNEFAVQHDLESYKGKFTYAKAAFNEVWETVKAQVESVVDDVQRKFLNNGLAVTSRVPGDAASGNQVEEAAWKNMWNWNLPDAAFGSLVLDVREGRVSSELKSAGFNFAYRTNASASAAKPANAVSSQQNQNQSQQASTNASNAAVVQNSRPPSAPRGQQSYHQNQNKPYQQQQPRNDNPHFNKHNNRKEYNKPQNASDRENQPSAGNANATANAKAESDSKASATEPSSTSVGSSDKAAANSEKSKGPLSPQIERPASSASSRRSSQQFNKNKSTEDPSADKSFNGDRSDKFSGRGRGGRGGNRGSFDKGNFRGRGRGGKPESERDSTSSPAPATTSSAAPATSAQAPPPAAATTNGTSDP